MRETETENEAHEFGEIAQLVQSIRADLVRWFKCACICTHGLQIEGKAGEVAHINFSRQQYSLKAVET